MSQDNSWGVFTIPSQKWQLLNVNKSIIDLIRKRGMQWFGYVYVMLTTKQQLNTSYVKFYFKVWWKLSGAFCRVGFRRAHSEKNDPGSELSAGKHSEAGISHSGCAFSAAVSERLKCLFFSELRKKHWKSRCGISKLGARCGA